MSRFGVKQMKQLSCSTLRYLAWPSIIMNVTRQCNINCFILNNNVWSLCKYCQAPAQSCCFTPKRDINVFACMIKFGQVNTSSIMSTTVLHTFGFLDDASDCYKCMPVFCWHQQITFLQILVVLPQAITKNNVSCWNELMVNIYIYPAHVRESWNIGWLLRMWLCKRQTMTINVVMSHGCVKCTDISMNSRGLILI